MDKSCLIDSNFVIVTKIATSKYVVFYDTSSSIFVQHAVNKSAVEILFTLVLYFGSVYIPVVIAVRTMKAAEYHCRPHTLYYFLCLLCSYKNVHCLQMKKILVYSGCSKSSIDIEHQLIRGC